MKLTSVRYGRTVSRNYQSTSVQVEVEFDPDAGETFEGALKEAKRAVTYALISEERQADSEAGRY